MSLRRVKERQESLESKGLKVNAKKSEVMVCSKTGNVEIKVVDRNGEEMPQVKKFKYLGSTLNETGGCEEEVKTRVKAGWTKWREISGVICDRRIPRKLKLKMYKTVIRPVLYGAETWALKKKEQALVERTEMRMLRWILGVSLKERKKNEVIRKMAGVTCISEKLKEIRLRWYGHVMRREKSVAIKKVWKEPIVGKRSQGRQRIRWDDVIRKDMKERRLTTKDTKDRTKWRRRIRAANP